jgi:hypothetical protein
MGFISGAATGSIATVPSAGSGFALVFKIGSVPAGPLQLETSGRDQLLVFAATTGRALGDRLIGHFLQMLLLFTALFAAVLINRHIQYSALTTLTQSMRSGLQSARTRIQAEQMRLIRQKNKHRYREQRLYPTQRPTAATANIFRHFSHIALQYNSSSIRYLKIGTYKGLKWIQSVISSPEKKG